MEQDSAQPLEPVDDDVPVAERAGRLLFAAQAQADRLREQTERELTAERGTVAELRAGAQRLHDLARADEESAARLEEEAVRRRADALEEASRRLELVQVDVERQRLASADEARQLLADAADQAAMVVAAASTHADDTAARAEREADT
ncbi:MAG: hypothetical protein H0U35_09460, partial [Sporichthyaceae bacterium]|nr:hypothetical protein [Sporichthyaceae bacterium]